MSCSISTSSRAFSFPRAFFFKIVVIDQVQSHLTRDANRFTRIAREAFDAQRASSHTAMRPMNDFVPRELPSLTSQRRDSNRQATSSHGKLILEIKAFLNVASWSPQ
jgi:hypothetical protein